MLFWKKNLCCPGDQLPPSCSTSWEVPTHLGQRGMGSLSSPCQGKYDVLLDYGLACLVELLFLKKGLL
jgi:hypothetical protein